MRTVAIGFLLAIVALGCGEATGSDPKPAGLEGAWSSQATPTTGQALNFVNGTYARAVIRATSAFGGEMQIEEGRYDKAPPDGKDWLFMPNKSTCHRAHPWYTLGLAVSDASLVVSFADGLATFERVPAGDGGAAPNVNFTFGCFEGGVFTPGPLADVVGLQ